MSIAYKLYRIKDGQYYVKSMSYLKIADGFKPFTCMESSYLNIDMYKFEPQ